MRNGNCIRFQGIHRVMVLSFIISVEGLASAASSSASANVQVYPTPPGLTSCADLTLEINGAPVWVEHLKQPYPADAPDWFRSPATENLVVNIATFACTGPCRLALHLGSLHLCGCHFGSAAAFDRMSSPDSTRR